MKIVVTGGNGMVGKCIRDIICNYPSHTFVFLNRSLNDNYSVDLTDRNNVLKFFKDKKFDYIIHLAADVGGLYKNLNNNISMFSNNIKINENVLEACIANNIKRGIFILSSCIFPVKYEYGVDSMDETMIHNSPPHYSNEGYAYSKRMLHIQCKNHNTKYDTKFICLVPVNLYGPYDNYSPTDSHLIPGLIQRFKQKIYTAYGTGNPLRQLLYAPDFADIICKVLLTEINIPNNTLICCSDKEYTINSIANNIKTVMKFDDDIKWNTDESDGCMKKTVSNAMFKKLFNNYVFTDLTEGLINTYSWYEKSIN